MEVLDSFDFDARPSRSRYAPVVKALVDDGKFAVKIKRGEAMFPDDVKIDSVQGGVRTAISKTGKRARTRLNRPDVVVVGLDPEPAPKRRAKRTREAVAA